MKQDFRTIYANALSHALVLEIDGDILKSFGVNMRAYVVECRELLKENYSIVPYPFDHDNYWD